MMPIRWTTPARRSLVDQIAFIAQDNVHAAQRVRDAIIAAVESLAESPHRGRQGQVVGTRELVVPHFPTYVVVYRVTESEVRILRVWHGRQRRFKT
jgi:addiction module RelE/StbE family toxin